MTQPSLSSSLFAAVVLASAIASSPTPARAMGNIVDVTVVDRDGASALPVHPHRGRSYLAGQPGSRYAIRVSNRTGERVMAVMSVDGVNILSGQTADSGQSGYVLSPWQSYEITGWRKSTREVAAFEFTALPDSYAARTGRPNDVGVIGVAVFKERVVVDRRVPSVGGESPMTERKMSERAVPERAVLEPSKADAGPADRARVTPPAALPAPPPSPSTRQEMRADVTAEPAQRLGTGHGARERSFVTTTTFVRGSVRPVEVVTLYYDRFENLLRAGVIPPYASTEPNAFPATARFGFVADPPGR